MPFLFEQTKNSSQNKNEIKNNERLPFDNYKKPKQ